ncbi:septum formation family protein [soil metagenome]
MTPTTHNVWARALAVTAIAAAGVLLSGCSLLSTITGGNTGTGGTGTTDGTDGGDTGGDTDVFTIKVGDCLNDADAGETVETVPLVDCSEPHDSEIYESVIMDDGDWPGDDVVTAQGDKDCQAAFETFVNIDYGSSALDFTYYRPTQETWEGIADREILCEVYDPAGQVTGTLAGAAK